MTRGCLFLLLPFLLAADWPTWRFDAARSASSPEQLAAQLHLQWSHSLAPARPAWPEDPRLHFDAALQPIVAGGILYVGSSANDRITAVDVKSGRRLWVFFADGPIRYAPLAHRGRLYFGADDGNFYCLHAKTGALVWKFPAAPGSRRALGNERMISVWPMRGGPVLYKNQIHFTIGVWPFEGNFLYSLDLEGQSGTLPKFKVRTLTSQLPQGYLVANNDQLLLPCGRGSAARFNLQTGKFVALRYTSRGKTDYHVSASGKWLFHGDRVVEMARNRRLPNVAFRPVTGKERAFGVLAKHIIAYDLKNTRVVTTVDKRGKKNTSETIPLKWKVTPQQIKQALGSSAKGKLRIHIQAGRRIYGSLGSTVFAVDLPEGKRSATISWKSKIAGSPVSMLAAAGRLFVVTQEGKVLAFGGKQRQPTHHGNTARVKLAKLQLPEQIRNQHGAYALVTRGADATFLMQVAEQTDSNVVALALKSRVQGLRRAIDKANRYGKRASVLSGPLESVSLPPYFAQTAFVPTLPRESTARAAFVARLYQKLRPYGGTAYIKGERRLVQELAKRLPNAKVGQVGTFVTLTRVGALPGSSDWTHEYSDPSNSLMSSDRLVKAPLGVLWFGGQGASSDLFFNRHYWSPSMAVIGGRMFMHGPRVFASVDVYTGRLLWKLTLKKGTSPGRRGNFFEKVRVGYHYVATKEWIYLSTGSHCKLIHPRSGKVQKRFLLPKGREWGRMRVWKNLLIVSSFEINEDKKKVPARLVALDRHTGRKVWEHKAAFSAPVVAIGKDKLYYFDGMIEGLYDDWKRRGKVPPASEFRYVKALDVRTGRQIWERTTERIVTWLSFSKQKNVLVASNKLGMNAFDGADGRELWKKKADGKGFRGHPENLWDKVILWNDRIIDQRGPGLSYDLRTGKEIQQLHPITGLPVKWEFTKIGHHCNYAVANPHMLTFRAGTAGFLDLASGGTGRLDGFRSGCRNSLIPANGVLNAPNYAHGCVCSYNLFTSLALVHIPDAEMWTYSPLKAVSSKQQVARVGINLGAPGDRQAKSGTLWLDYPSVGGPSPTVQTRAVVNGGGYFRLHSSQVKNGDLNWVGASGIEGVRSLTIQVGQKKEHDYQVNLYFLEPNVSQASGARVFDVAVGKQAIQGIDVTKEAGGARRLLVKRLAKVKIGRQITINFSGKAGLPIISGVELIKK